MLDSPMGQSIGTAEDNAGTEYQTLGQGAFSHHSLQSFSISPPQL
jgi:hypothetical protein